MLNHHHRLQMVYSTISIMGEWGLDWSGYSMQLGNRKSIQRRFFFDDLKVKTKYDDLKMPMMSCSRPITTLATS